MGLLKNVVLDIEGLTFVISLVVFNIGEVVEDYNIILGWPWLR